MRVVSGIRPTGHIHLGNYLGAIRSWVSLRQNPGEFLFFIGDQHALTTLEKNEDVERNTLTTAAAYIACGLNPNENIFFVQSHVPAHCEMMWYLGCFTPLGWLNRMTQFKDKAGDQKENAQLGLLAYPVLMASDVLLYGATHVPVGEDQKQHVELARDLALRMNHLFDKQIFIAPQPLIQKEAARIMSLRDGAKKMSKSDTSDYSRIHLLDEPDEITQKIRKAKTDSDPIPEHPDQLNDRPEALNLLGIYALLKNESLEKVCQEFSGQLFAPLKNALADSLIEHLTPIREEMDRLLRNERSALETILKEGAEEAQALCEENLKEMKENLRLLPVKE